MEQLLVIFAMFIASIIYAFANFSHANIKGKPIYYLITISITFAIVEYIIKIPTYHHAHSNKLFDTSTLQMMWLILTSISVTLFDKYYLKNKVEEHTYLSLMAVVMILILESYFKTID